MSQKEVVQGKKKTTYVLLSASWNVLCYYAEEISLRVPLQVNHTDLLYHKVNYILSISYCPPLLGVFRL